MRSIDFKQLDGLRGLAAIYVVINHCRGNLFIGGGKLAEVVPYTEWSIWDKIYILLMQTTSLGSEFVILFFVLSGFSITHSLASNYNLASFFKKRLLRIYPVYLLGFLFAIGVFCLTRQLRPEWFVKSDHQINEILYKNLDFVSFNNIIKTVFYMPKGSMIAQFWSLSHEVIFYFLVPLCFLRKRAYYTVTILLWLFAIGRYGIKDVDLSIWQNYLYNYNIYFAVGVAAYQYRELLYDKMPSKRIVYLGLAVIFFMLIATTKYFLGPNKVSGLLSVAGSVILVIASQKYKVCAKFLMKLGVFSYSLYVFHVACIYLFKLGLSFVSNYNGDFITNKFIWILAVPFCVGVSYVLYHVIEAPTISLLKKIRSNTRQNKDITVSSGAGIEG